MNSSAANTQYNHIVDAYSKLYPAGGQVNKDYPLAIIEDALLYRAVTDPSVSIHGKRVLDLASGNGYFASKFLRWGAASVTGVDISSGMLEAARKDAKDRDIPESKLKYVLGDATDESLTISGAPFDIVTGCWLLNYAPDTETMLKMWRFIGRHLRPGGVWVGLKMQPLLTDKPEEEQMLSWAMRDGPWGRHGNAGKVLGKVSGGLKVRLELGTAAQDEVAAFDTFHPRLEVFQESCRRSNMFTGLEWSDFVIPDELKKDRPPGYWNDLALWPHCRVCIARRLD